VPLAAICGDRTRVFPTIDQGLCHDFLSYSYGEGRLARERR
jgi:hypothetical protein